MQRFTLNVFLVIMLLGLTTSCFNDDIDDNLVTNTEINDFVWKSMNLWYFWQQDVSDLADNRFSSDEEYTNYLNSFSNPRALFDDIKFNEDRFSWIVDDYNDLLSSFQGVSKTNGVEFGLGRINDGDDLFGIVQYILPNTDASSKNIQRGDLFLSVDGISLHIDNYLDLLFSDSDNYTLNMAEISDNSIISNGIDVSLTKQVYTENPIFIAKTINVGNKKVGYLIYNRFSSNFDEQVNDAFGEFKANGIDEMVLDLRYNPGGSVGSAINISSMITGQFTGDLFLRQQWNDKWQAIFSDENLNSYFVDKLSEGGSVINSLNLSKVYILAQGSSASASELVINSLNPYIDVIHIGNNTVGKNEFSLTLLDIPTCSYVNFLECNDSPNPTHTWGIQPLVGRNANAIGFFDYADEGLIPDILFPEDLANFGILGEVDEPLLARALQHISGNGRTTYSLPQIPFEIISSSKMHTPMRDNMYIILKEDMLKKIREQQ